MLLEDRVWPLQRYRENHLPPGSFFKAILTNDLRQAAACADEAGRELLYDYTAWCERRLPEECWGSLEKYENWIAKREGSWTQKL